MAGGVVRFVRKRAMIYLWRAQQSGAMISITLLGTLTAASLYRDYLKAALSNYGFPMDQELPGLLITMILIFVGVFGVGYLFDRLKFWREQNIVAIERNPYGSYRLTAKEVYWIRMWAAAVSAGKPTEDQQKVVALFDQWIKRSVGDDPVLQAEVEAVEKWITTGDESIKKILDQVA